MKYFVCTLITGLVATGVMDVWGLLRKPLLGMPPSDYRFVGRWIGHLWRGQLVHRTIASSPAVHGESMIGWSAHYLLGMVFAACMSGIAGNAWIARPTLLPALAFGLATVTVPFFVMQPAMGAGFAASRTPRPNAARIQSVWTHAVFGLGLYVGGWASHLVQFK